MTQCDHACVDGCKKVVLTTDILALEVRPGTLLRITSNTSAEQFSNAAQAGDARATAGHLVSIIAASHSIDTAPLALLANYIQTALLQMHASDTTAFQHGLYHQQISMIYSNLKVID